MAHVHGCGFYSLHDGQEQPTGGGDLIGSLFPNFGLLGLDELVANHKYCRDPETLHDTEGLGDDWIQVARQQQGFVREFGWEVADDCNPVSASLTDYVDSVRISIESGTEHSGLLPTFAEGALIWDVDYSDSPPPVPPPKPTVIRIPFALTSFLPSQIGPEDDLIDLDVVRQAIIDTA